MKRVNITTVVLLVYLIVMAVIGWPGDNPEKGYTEYLGIMGVSVVVILLLRFVQIKRLKTREEMKNQNMDSDK